MKRKINKNTCMLVGSAPCFNAGVIDPIEEIAKVRKYYDSSLMNFANIKMDLY